MYQYSFDDNTTKKIKDRTKTSGDIFEEFGKVDSKYNNLTKSDAKLNLERLDYNFPSEDEIKQKAENKLYEYKNNGINSIESGYETKNEALDSSKDDIIKNTKQSMDTVEGKYENAKENAKNDAIKRGLARSSIVVNTLSNLDAKKLSSLSELENSKNEKIEALNAQKSTLEQEKQNALNSFNLTYAIKLQDEIDSITSEIEKNRQSVIKYNNEIEQLQAKWEKQRQDDEYDKTTNLAKLVSQYGTSVFDILKRNEKYAIASEYFAGLSKEDAINEITNNSEYKTALGTANYNKLLEEINARK